MATQISTRIEISMPLGTCNVAYFYVENEVIHLPTSWREIGIYRFDSFKLREGESDP
jgi:hypothetical protein